MKGSITQLNEDEGPGAGGAGKAHRAAKNGTCLCQSRDLCLFYLGLNSILALAKLSGTLSRLNQSKTRSNAHGENKGIKSD